MDDDSLDVQPQQLPSPRPAFRERGVEVPKVALRLRRVHLQGRGAILSVEQREASVDPGVVTFCFGQPISYLCREIAGLNEPPQPFETDADFALLLEET